LVPLWKFFMHCLITNVLCKRLLHFRDSLLMEAGNLNFTLSSTTKKNY